MPATAVSRNSAIAMKNTIFASSTNTTAMPPKPSTPAINAMMRKVTAQLSMTFLLAAFDYLQHVEKNAGQRQKF